MPSPAAAPASLTPPVLPYQVYMFSHLLPCCLLDYQPPWHRGGTLNWFIKWINTELPQFCRSQCCPLGSQNKPAQCSSEKPFRGWNPISFSQWGWNDSPYKGGCDYAMRKADCVNDISHCNPSIIRRPFSSQHGQSLGFRRKRAFSSQTGV